MGRNAGVLNGALGLPSLLGADLHRSPATVRLLAVEPFQKRQNSVIRLLGSKKTATPPGFSLM
jgi:hypothetical protein